MLAAALCDPEAAGRMVTDLLSTSPDPDLPAASAWTVRQATVHLIAGAGMYAACLRGAPSPLHDMRPNTLSAFNDGAFLALTERDVGALGALHDAALTALHEAALDGEPDRIVDLPRGSASAGRVPGYCDGDRAVDPWLGHRDSGRSRLAAGGGAHGHAVGVLPDDGAPPLPW